MSNIHWWFRQIFFLVLSIFFLLFGISILIAAYRLDNPFMFIMTFFASNLIILISGTIAVGLVIRSLPSQRKRMDENKKDISDP
jgi:hypothetical protein